MAILELPVRSDIPAYSFKIDLDGASFRLKFYFNKRLGRWFMDILDASDVLLISGIILLTNLAIRDQYVKDGIPAGQFILIDETGNEKNPGEFDLGNDVRLFYQEAE